MTEFLLASDLDPATILARLRAAADAVAGAMRGGESESLIEAIQTPRQREILDRLTALMTLVEGHGDYVMDAVGPQVVPSVAEIRERFNARRRTAGRVEQAIRRLLGIDLKMRQYADGARFVQAVVDEVGMDGFNKVWDSPATIPTRSEITNPHAWIARVAAGFGAAAAPPVSAPLNGTSPVASVGPASEPGPAADDHSGGGGAAADDQSGGAADAPQAGEAPQAVDAGQPGDAPGAGDSTEARDGGEPGEAGRPAGDGPADGD
jgi:hypothetical protein